MTATAKFKSGLQVFLKDVYQGFFEVTHSGFALLGLAVMFAALTLATRPEIRHAGELQLMSWLQNRQIVESGINGDLEAIDRTTAANPKSLPKQQAAVAYWLSKKYSVAPEPVSALVAEAFDIASYTKLEPTLILAVIAVESGFNPFAQSAVGAQGLMQVMTKVHSEKYQGFGGKLAAFDPLANLRVGSKVLQDCISKAGSVAGGLKLYVGAANLEDDGGYTVKVMSEHERLQQVMAGKTVPIAVPQVMPVVQPVKPSVTTESVASLY